MLRLKTLGSIDLRADRGTSLDEELVQPKRVALLVYLAAQGGSFCRRDSLLALLWPELDTDRARHSLRQAVYQLRRGLGQGVILGRGEEELGIDPARLWCDCVAFRALIGEGKAEEALGLYGGDFLAGFHSPDASDEFEDWIAATRLEHRSAAIRAALRLAEEAVGSGNLDQALEYARRAAAIDPLDEGIQISLIRVLGQKGDKAGAQRAYKAFADRLDRDLNAAPSAPTRQALAEAERVRAASPVSPEPRVEPIVVPARRDRRFWIGGSVIALGLALAVTTVVLTRRSPKTPNPSILAVAAIRQVSAGSDSTNLLPVADLLATSLAQLPTMQVLSNARLIEIEQALKGQGQSPAPSEVARRAKATELLEGSLFRLEDSLVLELRQVELATGKVLHGYRVGARDVFTLVDRATAEIARVADVRSPARRVADVTTGSLVAYRLYQEGLNSYYAGDNLAARRFFGAAVAEDSTFAMAMWYLGRAEEAMLVLRVQSHHLAALRLASGASDRERLLITADIMRSDLRAAALAVAETLAARYPSDPEGVLMLGMSEVAASNHGNAVRTIRRAIALDSGITVGYGSACRLCESYRALTHAYLWQDSLTMALATAREFVRVLPNQPMAWSALGEVAALLDDTLIVDSAQAVFERLSGLPQGIGINAALIGKIARGSYLSADTELVSLGVVSQRLRGELRWYLSISLRNQGRLREAIALARDGTLPAGGPLPRWILGPDSILLAITLFENGDTRSCRRLYRFAANTARPDLRGWPGTVARERTWALSRLAMCRAADGDTTGFERLADSLETIGATSLYGRDQRLHHYVRGMLWKARGDSFRAASEFAAAISSPNFGFTRINYELAGALLALRRPAEAVATLQPALRGALDASNLYLTRTEIHERLAQAWEAAGNRDSARVHWTQVDRAWKDADPQFRSRWEAAHRHTVN